MKAWVTLGLAAAAGAAMGAWVSAPIGVASLSYGLMLGALAFRARRQVHGRMMVAGAALDVGLVLVLELQRSAIGTVLGGKLNAWQLSHVLCSLAAVVLYLPTIVMGLRAFRGRAGSRERRVHRALGVATMVLRSLSYVLMFSMLGLAARA